MLSNVYSNWGQLRKSLEFARKFYDLANQMEDTVATAAAKMMINDLSTFLQNYFSLLNLCELYITS